MINRIDLFARTAGEKAQKPDEFITKSQLVAGSRITLEDQENFDIKIVASGNIDGGFANSVYLPTQRMDGGGA